jgi:hypothetical protein
LYVPKTYDLFLHKKEEKRRPEDVPFPICTQVYRQHLKVSGTTVCWTFPWGGVAHVKLLQTKPTVATSNVDVDCGQLEVKLHVAIYIL